MNDRLGQIAARLDRIRSQLRRSALRRYATELAVFPEHRRRRAISKTFRHRFKSFGAIINRAPSVLDKVQILGVDNGQTGELKVRIDPIANAKGFDGRIKSGTGDYGPTISFQNSKSILFKGLTAGITYTLQLCAIGGSTGAGDWSDPVSHMAM